MTITQKTYVYKNTEVVKTGRIAQSQTVGRRGKHHLYEITPANTDEGSWTTWVRETDLYEIIDTRTNTDE